MRMITLLMSALLVVACGDGGRSNEKQGSYGASSGPNPNLSDIQQQGAAPTNDAGQPSAPSAGIGDTYPSQAGETTPAVTPGAEGGRSSAATGASGDPASNEQAGAEAQGRDGRQEPR